MTLPYKNNFYDTKVYQKYVKDQIKHKKHSIGNDGIPVSLEFGDRERGKEFYDQSWQEHQDRDKINPYMIETINLCSIYHNNPESVLEVGAGCGGMALEFIKKFKPKRYVAYEFSDAAKKIVEKVEKNSLQDVSDIKVIQGDFRDVKNLEGYDCFIALEIFEHISWDLDFISKIPSGKWLFFSVPVKHAKDHVRAFLSHESIWKRYKDLIDIKEINSLFFHEDMYKWWCVASIRK